MKKTSPDGKAKTLQAVSEVIQPTSKLDGRDLEVFQYIVSSREADSWSDTDRMIATQLASAMRRLEEINMALDEEGPTTTNLRGTPVVNPLLTASMQMTSTIQQLTRTLGLSASQRGKTGQEQQVRNKADQDARKIIKGIAEDSLLA